MDKPLSSDMGGTGKGLATIQGDGGTGRKPACVPGCEPATGSVGGSQITSPAAGMVSAIKGK